MSASQDAEFEFTFVKLPSTKDKSPSEDGSEVTEMAAEDEEDVDIMKCLDFYC